MSAPVLTVEDTNVSEGSGIDEGKGGPEEFPRPVVEQQQALTSPDVRAEGGVPAVDTGASTSVVVPDFLRPVFHRSFRRKAVFLVSKMWEGQVISQEGDSFLARLKDTGEPDAPEEETDFLLADINEDDLPLVQEGALFVFSVGHHIDDTGSLSRQSTLRFRRFPNWNPDEIIDAHTRAKEIVSKIEIE